MNQTKRILLPKLPTSVEELSAMADLSSPYNTAALAVAVLCRYEKDVPATLDMLNWLKGPQPLTEFDKQFLRDRLAGKGYVPRSFLQGTGPDNDYTPPAPPYAVEIGENPYSYTNEGYAVLWLTSTGADSPRQITLRRKGDGNWLLWQHSFIGDVRPPKSADPWA